MKQLTVSEEMKAKLEPFRNAETGIYDIEAIREEMRKQPRARFSGIFSGSGDADQQFEHTMLSAAVQLNEEIEMVLGQQIQGEEVALEIINGELFKDFDYEHAIPKRTRYMSIEQKRVLVQILLATMERKSVATPIYNRCLTGLKYIKVNDTTMSASNHDAADFFGNDTYNIGNALRFVEGDSLEPKTDFLFTDEIEEYLASRGL